MPLLFDRGMECLVVKYKTFSNQDRAQFYICLFVHHLFVTSITKRILCDTLLKNMHIIKAGLDEHCLTKCQGLEHTLNHKDLSIANTLSYA